MHSASQIAAQSGDMRRALEACSAAVNHCRQDCMAQASDLASGEAEAILLKAQATAHGIDAVAKSISDGKGSAQSAVNLRVAEKYVDAFGELAKEGTSVVVPGNVGDIGQMIATAMSIYGKVSGSQSQGTTSQLQDGRKELSDNGSQTSSEGAGDKSVAQTVLQSFEETANKK